MAEVRRIPLTLVLVHDRERILLGLKKKGFGAGRWNGFGGKVEKGESVVDAAHRELREEAGIEVPELAAVGILEFSFIERPGEILEVHVFRATEFVGEPCESDEMVPRWFAVDDIPFDQMWPDDRFWFPLFLAGKSFRGAFTFGPHDAVLKSDLREAADLVYSSHEKA